MSSLSYEQPTSLAIPQNDISYKNEPPMSSHLPQKATFPVSQGWLLIAGSTVFIFSSLILDNYAPLLCPLLVLGLHVGAGDARWRHREEGWVGCGWSGGWDQLIPQHLHLTLIHHSLTVKSLCKNTTSWKNSNRQNITQVWSIIVAWSKSAIVLFDSMIIIYRRLGAKGSYLTLVRVADRIL